MTPNDAPSTIPGTPTPFRVDEAPGFQNLLAKVETNFYRNRPKEAAELNWRGRFGSPSRNARPRHGKSSRRRARRASDGPGPGADLRIGLPTAGVRRQLILESDTKAPQLTLILLQTTPPKL